MYAQLVKMQTHITECISIKNRYIVFSHSTKLKGHWQTFFVIGQTKIVNWPGKIASPYPNQGLKIIKIYQIAEAHIKVLTSISISTKTKTIKLKCLLLRFQKPLQFFLVQLNGTVVRFLYSNGMNIL